MGGGPSTGNQRINFSSERFQFKQNVIKGKRPSQNLAFDQENASVFLFGQEYQVMNSQQKKGYLLQNDDRLLVSNTLQYPFCCIGKLQIKFKGTNAVYLGTGCLIYKNLVLTCAHNIHNRQKNLQKVTFYPGVSKVGRGYEMVHYYIPEEYKNQQCADDSDYAILQLQSSPGQRHGYFGLNFQGIRIKQYRNDIVQLYGYPLNVYINKKQQKGDSKMYGQKGKFQIDQSNRFIIYKINTSPGQSGSPVFLKDSQGQCYVVGVHTNSVTENINRGVLLQEKIKNQFNSWLQENTRMLNLNNRNLGNSERINWMYKSEDLAQVKILSLNQNNIKNMPNDLNLFPLLQHFSASSNLLTNFGFNIKPYKSLKSVNLSSNRLASIDLNIGYLTSLRDLNLSNNMIQIIPDGIRNLVDLKAFNISKNLLEKIPSAITNLKKLQYLNVSNNRLEQMVQFMPGSNLKYLIAHHNSIDKIKVNQLSDLIGFNMSNNQLKSVPAGIGNLKDLRFLILSENNLEQFNQDFTQGNSLQFLDIQGNRIQEINLKNLDKLQKLNVSSNLISQLPKEIINLEVLNTLNLAYNKIKLLPESISYLKKIDHINISFNRIEILPLAIKQLVSLRILLASNNQLQKAQGLSTLNNLSELDLSKNKLLDFPDDLAHLKNIEIINLSWNRIEKLPNNLHKLGRNVTLDCRKNPLDFDSKQLLESIEKQGYAKIFYNHRN